jgi:hypothetical protein
MATTRTLALRILRWLTMLSIVVGILATFSYSSGAEIGWRYLDPRFGAWLNPREFWIMEGAATALGTLVGIRIGASMVEDAALKARCAEWSLIISAIAFKWATPLCARIARIGADGRGTSMRARLVALGGYGTGLFLDKLFVGGVYFLKTAGFALLLGLALFALMIAIFMTARRDAREQQQPATGA